MANVEALNCLIGKTFQLEFKGICLECFFNFPRRKGIRSQENWCSIILKFESEQPFTFNPQQVQGDLALQASGTEANAPYVEYFTSYKQQPL